MLSAGVGGPWGLESLDFPRCHAPSANHEPASAVSPLSFAVPWPFLSLAPPTLPDSLCTSLPASLHRSLSLTHTSPSQAHCYLLLLLLIVLLLIITPSLTASLSTLLRSTCIFRSHLPLLLSTSPAADDNPAERLRRCSPLISIHPVRRRTHPRTHARAFAPHRTYTPISTW